MTVPKTTTKRPWARRLLRLLLILLIIAAALAVLAWYRIFRELPQPRSITGAARWARR